MAAKIARAPEFPRFWGQRQDNDAGQQRERLYPTDIEPTRHAFFDGWDLFRSLWKEAAIAKSPRDI